jgi:CheY-like chemotaxis protein
MHDPRSYFSEQRPGAPSSGGPEPQDGPGASVDRTVRGAGAVPRDPVLAEREDDGAGIRQVSDVLVAVHREIRAPMNAMIGTARLLLQTRLDEEQQALVDLIWKSGQTTLRLVNDAYELTHAPAGALDLDSIPFDLRVTVDETSTSLAPLVARTGLALECRVHPAVPSRLRGDPGRLRQVLLNLGERAIKSLASGRVEMLVSRLRESEQSVTLRFLVVGNGVAVAGPSGGQPGVELGLAVVQRLADLMGGRTGIEWPEGGGCRCWFDVDLQKQEEFEPVATPHLSKAEIATRRALIVDASPVLRRTLRSRLERAGCRAAEAGGAEEAHCILRAAVETGDPFHFVLIDRDLPGLDGEELGAVIQADDALGVARTVMLTTVGRRGDAARAHARGFSAFLPKAMEVEELVEALCEVTRQAMATPPGGTPELVTRYSLAEGRRSKTRILLVDDDGVSQVVTQWCLGRLGYRLEMAGTIAAARSAWAVSRFDLVLVDERLADGDALALARALRAEEGDAPHAAVVGMFRQEGSPEWLAWRESGAGEQVAKPVDLVVLTRLVERLTGTGLPTGSAAEDEYSGMLDASGPATAGGRLEIVTPDVERILTEPELQEAMDMALASAVAVPVVVGALAAAPEPAVAGDPAAPEAALVEDELAVPASENEPVVVAPEDEPVVVAPEDEPVVVVPEDEQVGVAPEDEPVVVVPEDEQVVVVPEDEPVVVAPEDEPVVVAPEAEVPWAGAEPDESPVSPPAVEPAAAEAGDSLPEAVAIAFGDTLAPETDWSPSALAEVELQPTDPAAAFLVPDDDGVWDMPTVQVIEALLPTHVRALDVTEPAPAVEPGDAVSSVRADDQADGWGAPERVAEDAASYPTVAFAPPPEAGWTDGAVVEQAPAGWCADDPTPDELVTGQEESGEVERAAAPEEPVHLEVVGAPACRAGSGGEAAGFDLDRLESASMGLPRVRSALLGAFLSEINPFLERLSWLLSDEDAMQVAAEAHGLVVLSRSVGAIACAEALEELERRGGDGALTASDPVLRRCYGEGLNAATEVRALLGPRRAAA